MNFLQLPVELQQIILRYAGIYYPKDHETAIFALKINPRFNRVYKWVKQVIYHDDIAVFKWLVNLSHSSKDEPMRLNFFALNPHKRKKLLGICISNNSSKIWENLIASFFKKDVQIAIDLCIEYHNSEFLSTICNTKYHEYVCHDKFLQDFECFKVLYPRFANRMGFITNICLNSDKRYIEHIFTTDSEIIGKTMLFAIRHGHIQLLSIILPYCTKVEKQRKQYMIAAVNAKYANSVGICEIIMTLHDNNFYMVDDIIFYAIDGYYPIKVIELLLKLGAKTTCSRTINRSIKLRRVHLITYLVAIGFPLADDALIEAIETGSWDVVEKIIDVGAKYHYRALLQIANGDRNEATSLFNVVRKTYPQILNIHDKLSESDRRKCQTILNLFKVE